MEGPVLGSIMKYGKDARKPVTEPLASEPSPFHSIFRLKTSCPKCKPRMIGQDTCFLAWELNTGHYANREAYIFATAAHAVFCLKCSTYKQVEIYKQVDIYEGVPLTTGPITEKSAQGWLKVSSQYPKQDPTNTNRYLYDYGVIAANKSSCKLPLQDWSQKSMLTLITSMKKGVSEWKAYVSGYSVSTYYNGKKEKAKRCQYWVPTACPAKRTDLKNQLDHFVDTSPGQSGGLLFTLPAGKPTLPAYVLGIHVGGVPQVRNMAVPIALHDGTAPSPPLQEILKWLTPPPTAIVQDVVLADEGQQYSEESDGEPFLLSHITQSSPIAVPETGSALEEDGNPAAGATGETGATEREASEQTRKRTCCVIL
eukprot:scpid87945/ scgid28962/ 